MISTENISLAYGKRVLFDEVNIKFTPGNCYGVIGANGAGKSTLLRALAGLLSSESGSIEIVEPEAEFASRVRSTRGMSSPRCGRRRDDAPHPARPPAAGYVASHTSQKAVTTG